MLKVELPHCSLEGDYSNERPRLRFADGGRLVQLSFARSPAAEWNAEHFGARAGVRGKCKGFSFGSRRRMLNRLNSVSVAAPLPYFVTATLPDEVFNDSVEEFAKLAKHWLDNFLKRLKRACPTACGFWRIEWQSRKSGKYEGRLVPHFHLLVWGLPERVIGEKEVYDKWHGNLIGLYDIKEAYIDCEDTQLAWDFVRTVSDDQGDLVDSDELRTVTSFRGEQIVFHGSRRYVDRCRRVLDQVIVGEVYDNPKVKAEAAKMSFADWASLAWYHVVASNNRDHLSAGLRVERVKSWGGVMSYCAKYMAKSDCEFLYSMELGRSWGIFNRSAVPWAKMVELNLPDEMGVRIRRVARRYLEHRFGRRVRMPYGCTLYCDVEKFRALWKPPEPF